MLEGLKKKEGKKAAPDALDGVLSEQLPKNKRRYLILHPNAKKRTEFSDYTNVDARWFFNKGFDEKLKRLDADKIDYEIFGSTVDVVNAFSDYGLKPAPWVEEPKKRGRKASGEATGE